MLRCSFCRTTKAPKLGPLWCHIIHDQATYISHWRLFGVNRVFIMNFLTQSRIYPHHCKKLVNSYMNDRHIGYLLRIQTRLFTTSKLQDYLKVLRITKTSTPKEIKDSFLKLSKIYHPDNKETGSHAKFVYLKEAYDAMKDGCPQADSLSPPYSAGGSKSYYDTDYTHHDYMRYRQQRDNTADEYWARYKAASQSRPFKGPFASQTAWQDFTKNQSYKEYLRRTRPLSGKSYTSPLMNVTLVLGAMAWIFIYSSVLLLWDYNDNMRKDNRKSEQEFKERVRRSDAYRRHVAEVKRLENQRLLEEKNLNNNTSNNNTNIKNEPPEDSQKQQILNSAIPA